MIYDKNYKELKQELINFSKTVYGKSIFLISYASFFISIISLIICFVLFLKTTYFIFAILFIFLVLITTFTFCIGSYTYYKELRIYIKNKE